MVGYRWQGELQFGGYTSLLYYLVNGVTYILAFALPPLLYLAIKRQPLQRVLLFEKTPFSTALACVFLGMGVCMLANFPANWMADFLEWAGYSGTLPDSPLTGEPSIQALYFISLAVIPPLVEELVFPRRSAAWPPAVRGWLCHCWFRVLFRHVPRELDSAAICLFFAVWR